MTDAETGLFSQIIKELAEISTFNNSSDPFLFFSSWLLLCNVDGSYKVLYKISENWPIIIKNPNISCPSRSSFGHLFPALLLFLDCSMKVCSVLCGCAFAIHAGAPPSHYNSDPCMEANLASRVSGEHRLCGRGQEKFPFMLANVAFFKI